MAMLDHEKIIEALAATLENEVLPALGKGPARLQLYSVLDVLENLSAYLEWGGQLAELEVAACRRAASQLAGWLEGALSARFVRKLRQPLEGLLRIAAREIRDESLERRCEL